MAKAQQERNAVIEAYPANSIAGSAWTMKVNQMSDQQVHAIYMRLKNQGRIK